MRNLFQIVLLLVLVSASLFAQGRNWNLKFTGEFVSAYMGTNASLFDTSAATRTIVNFTYKFTDNVSAYAAVWAAYDVDGGFRAGDFGDELDYTAGLAFSGPWQFVFDVSLTYIDAVPLYSLPKGDVWLPVFVASKTFRFGNHQFKPYLACELPFPHRSDGPASGQFFYLGVSDEFQILHSNLTVGLNSRLAHDSGAFGFDPGFFARYRNTLTWNFSKNFSISGYARYGIPISEMTLRDKEVVYGASATLVF